MLNTTKSISLMAKSKVVVDDKEVVAIQLNANITESGNSNINVVIINQEAYELNKEDCRADIDEFNALVRSVEDGE